MRRLLFLLLLLPTSLWAQQLPQEAQPLQPPTRVLWVEVVPDVPLIPQDASTQIDVLYVITSSYTTSQATADTLCAQMITRGNEVLANDPAETSRLHLVGCKIITWTSVTDTGDLSAITNPATGALYPQVNTWRNDFGADLVQMIGTFTNSCGQGYQCTPNFGAQWAYSVVQGSCAVGNYSAVHEMGHNVCLAHDLANQTPTFTYGSGFCDPAGRRDPMSYQSSALSPNACTGSRVSYFGNPNISPFGAPFGTTLNFDNARVWRNEAAAVAAFRAPVVPPTCPTITLSPATLPNGYTGRAYSQLWTATGGTGPYSFAVSAGTVPAGLTFTTATLSGTPTTAGASTFTVRATDTLACTGTTGYTLTILQLPSAPTNLTALTAPPGRGPQPTITCPAGAVAIGTAASIQSAINANVGATTFCLAAGVHALSTACSTVTGCVPKSGNTFIGAYGAILDGQNVSPYAFYSNNLSQTNVTIKNLEIKNFTNPDTSFGAITGNNVTNWTVLNNSAHDNGQAGIRAGTGTGWVVSNNLTYNNGANGITGYQCDGAVIENNEMYNNGATPVLANPAGVKILGALNLTIRGNFVHNNVNVGIWSDTNYPTTTIEDNTVTNNQGAGIWHEIGYAAIIRNNIVTGNGTPSTPITGWIDRAGIQTSNSPNVQIYGNTVQGNRQGITAMYATGYPATGPYGTYIVQNLDVHDNTVCLITGSGTNLGKTGLATTTGDNSIFTSQNNHFTHNTYTLQTNSAFFVWAGVNKTFAQWQAVPNDATGTMTVGTCP